MNIAVVFGGVSCEHDISIITACQVMNVLREKHEVIPIYIDKDGVWRTGENLVKIEAFSNGLGKTNEVMFSNSNHILYIKRLGKFRKMLEIDMVFLALHGKNGEDGAAASIFELNGIPYANAGICSSAVACDKAIFKEFVKGLRLPCVKSFTLTKDCFKYKKEEVLNLLENRIGFPLIIKPANLGSSIGISVVQNKEKLQEQLFGAFEFDNKLLIEKYVQDMREINIAIYRKNSELVISELEEPVKSAELLSFKDKYETKNKSLGMASLKRKIPADIPSDIKEKIIKIAVRCYKALDLFGICRFDFILDSDNKVYLNEVNTIPGSYAFYLFEPKGKNFQMILEDQISEAKHRSIAKKKLINTFESSTLKNLKLSGTKGKF